MASLRPVPLTAFGVRRAVPADADQLFPLWQRAREHNAKIDRRITLAPIDPEQFAVALHTHLQRKSTIVLVAETARAELAGFISGAIESAGPDRLPERHATIGYLWVEPPFRRRGIARTLVAEVARWAATIDGVRHFEMPVLAADQDAARFWAALGFRPFIARLWAPLQPSDEDAP
ncbi:GNAT family N-acetyltransferase [Tepidiforma sp.]|uniref:GNAT family N-acetyltransferase n=1 Tax=Tepidiforma sp. TaxID=2682230 RepID=UPI002ADD7382|nr:GNAT family N-acetyltransferase [Tepidiforma sp.]